MQTLKNKAFRVSIQWNALVRKLLALERGGFTNVWYLLLTIILLIIIWRIIKLVLKDKNDSGDKGLG
ncbi:hypothetical protein JT258_06600 [Helicobacter pylori]|uniref:hypothetical protein n=1 Tax=Helicobacter pylori TaxID=210 RepID=UPI000F71EA54|nr:hypothetical protein [Helicobacter pylori]MCQ2844080.1 hypothetical protein [Helicobacter pylori]MCQ2874225.1 hypothetical protein [Helicobacter pylori]MCQ2895764.1 hypothetical protein [Helicobacter pylori]VEJ23150.1 Uncharacterised protein [Helicobacter pylori]